MKLELYYNCIRLYLYNKDENCWTCYDFFFDDDPLLCIIEGFLKGLETIILNYKKDKQIRISISYAKNSVVHEYLINNVNNVEDKTLIHQFHANGSEGIYSELVWVIDNELNLDEYCKKVYQNDTNKANNLKNKVKQLKDYKQIIKEDS